MEVKEQEVIMREEDIVIPTYRAGKPEELPMFLETRVYQGSSGKVYPLPVTETLSHEKEDVTYRAVILENAYIMIMILPELGGRIQRALDKTNGYDFIYYNRVIKPALVGLAGPWISGGIEFNWPQHHRPTTFMPVDYTLIRNPDSSCTVALGETDPMYGMKGMARISLHPGKAYIEIEGQLYNPLDQPKSFLWWANPAVHVNDSTYSVFPPDVNAVMDHGRRAVSTFPIATGEYYKYDYSAGVDISRYKNIKVPTSYMAAHSEFDFIGNYDESVKAGLLHVADHHISPGKKQWTWGNGGFGHSWDMELTDEDGPYIELMTGVYTDNQPDFSWMKPHEEKTFVQYFMPYKGVGRVGNATRDALIGVDTSNPHQAVLRVYVTADYPQIKITVTDEKEKRILLDVTEDLSPKEWFEAVFDAGDEPENCLVKVKRQSGALLAQYKIYKKESRPIPQPAEPMLKPGEMKSVQELFLAGRHLEQYHHATRNPEDYYNEGLKRDPQDIQINNACGLLELSAGDPRTAAKYFQKAIDKQSWKNPNPYSGECWFNYGVAMEECGEREKAYDAFYKAAWSGEMQGVSFYHLACLSSVNQEYQKALAFIDQSLQRNTHDMKARVVKAALLRRLHQDRESFLNESQCIDPLCMGILYEAGLSSGDLSAWETTMRGAVLNYLKLSLEYFQAGFTKDAISILEHCPKESPMLYYYRGYFENSKGNKSAAVQAYECAETARGAYCFPNTAEERMILEDCIRTLGQAPMAEYYIGNLLYDKKKYEEAIGHWESAVKMQPTMAAAHRNMAIAYFNKRGDKQRAWEEIKTACDLSPVTPRLWLERDQLSSRCALPLEERLKMLTEHADLLPRLDMLYLRYITLQNCLGAYEEALQNLKSHRFHPWEGGEGSVSGQYRRALIELAKRKLLKGDTDGAIQLLQAALTYPENLGEGKLPNVPDNEIHYWIGRAFEDAGDEKEAVRYYTLATGGSAVPEKVIYYNDQPSDYIYYQGLAWRALGKEEAARKSFHQMISFGERHVFDKVEYDFFAVSLPELEVFHDDLNLKNRQYCNYLCALGYLGVGRIKEALGLLEGVLAAEPDHQGARIHYSVALSQ